MSAAAPFHDRAGILKFRSRIVRAIREFFDAAGYLEVETPCLVPSTVPEPHIDLFSVEGGLLLAASPEPQMKRLLAEGLGRIYQIGRAFRRGESGRWHNPEFTMLEWYRPHAGHLDLMDEVESLVSLLAAVAGRSAPVFCRISVDDAYSRWAGWRPSAGWDEERFYRDLVERVEHGLVHAGAVFLHGYPAPAASLARIDPADPALCERFELYLDGIEMANAFTELTDASTQAVRLEESNRIRSLAGAETYPVDERFLQALAQGLPPSAGIALGLDRIVAWLAGTEGIGPVMSFPIGSL